MNKIVEIKFGSHLYGTDTPNSDLDIKGIYLPTARQIVLGTYSEVINISRKKEDKERNTKDDTDAEYFSLDRYVSELMDGQTWALDFLFAPESSVIGSVPGPLGYSLIKELRSNRDKLLTKNINAFIGYARRQSHKYGLKGTRMDALKRTVALLDTLPLYDRLSTYSDQIYALVEESKALVSMEKTPLIEVVDIPGPDRTTPMPHLHVCGRKMGFQSTVKVAKECYDRVLNEYGERAKVAHLDGGVDFKALSHAVRVNHEALELLSTGNITFPRPEKELLLSIKKRMLPPQEIYAMIEEGMVSLEKAFKESSLREAPDKEWADDFIYFVYQNIVRKG